MLRSYNNIIISRALFLGGPHIYLFLKINIIILKKWWVKNKYHNINEVELQNLQKLFNVS